MQKLSIFPGIDEEDSKTESYKTVDERQDVVDEPVIQEEVQIEHVIKNEPVDGPLPIRTEGDTVIVPLVKQVVRVEKEWILTEEVHLTRRRRRERGAHPVTVLEEHAEVERIGESGKPEVESAVESKKRGLLGGHRPSFLGKLEK